MYQSHMLQPSRRNFLRRAATIGVAGCLGAHRAVTATRAPSRDNDDPPGPCAVHLHRPAVHRRGVSAARRVHRRAVPAAGNAKRPLRACRRTRGHRHVGRARLDPHLDAGKPIVLLAGVHAGCYELFGTEGCVRSATSKVRRWPSRMSGGGDQVLISSMLAYIGINPQHEVTWIAGENVTDAMDLFVSGKADAFLGYAQQPEELRLKQVGHVIVDTAQDRPWSQYFCCMVAANRDFVQRHPIATKHVLRAILKATDICAADPLHAARFLSDKLYEPRFQIGLNVMQRLPYNFWREADPEDTLRFHALRLHEAGLIQVQPADS